MEHIYDVLILGGGPAGLAAGIYAARSHLDTLLVEKGQSGGQIALTAELENYPGQLLEGETGLTLSQRMAEQAGRLGMASVSDTVRRAQLEGPVKRLEGEKGVYLARSLIIAAGAAPRPIGCENEEKFIGAGISYCATCDGAFFQGAEVAIVGGGNTALEDALFLSNNCAAVHLIHRRDQFRGSSILAEAVKKRQNIHLHLNSVVEEITGEEKVAGARLRDVTTGEETRLELSGVFVAVGLAPDNAAFAGQLALDGAGYIQAGEDCRTNLAGVFAAGDTRTKEVRQIITAAADGAVAALGAANYVNSLE